VAHALEAMRALLEAVRDLDTPEDASYVAADPRCPPAVRDDPALRAGRRGEDEHLPAPPRPTLAASTWSRCCTTSTSCAIGSSSSRLRRLSGWSATSVDRRPTALVDQRLAAEANGPADPFPIDRETRRVTPRSLAVWAAARRRVVHLHYGIRV
jgi:hypothetical protein